MQLKFMVYCKFRKENEVKLTHDIHNLNSCNIPTYSDTFGFGPRCLKKTVIQLCINQNDHFDLCTTEPTHISCKFKKYKYM